MSRKKNIPPARDAAPSKQHSHQPVSKTKQPPHRNPLYAALLLALIAFGLYANSIGNEYVLDDVISITGNAFTKNGLAGIPDLFNKDSFHGFIGNASELSGGRWRPLALVTFAVEWELSPNNPHLSHLINVLLYALTAFALFFFVYRFIFKNSIGASFATTLLFVVHPLHTEVVANIKSRDELLSFLLLIGTLWCMMRYTLENKTALLLVSLVCFFLALLSKENGLTFVAIVPMTLYVFARLDFKNALVKSLPYVGVAALYFMLRVAVIGFMQKSGGIQEIMNAPYLYATASQALATKLLVLGMYIKLLFWPHPLSYDYSYNQIPYVDFSNGWVWLAVLVQAGLLGVAFWKIRERSVLAYGILFYFFSIFIVSNLVIDIGGTLGERFLYQASFGAALSVVAAAMLAFDKLAVTEQKRFAASAAVLFIVCLPAAVKTVARNPDWKNDKTLFSKDVYVVPNAARARNGAGTAYILLSDDAKSDSLKRAALLDTAVLHLNEALRIHPTYIDPLLNMGVVYNRTGDIEKAEEYWNKARARQEAHPKLKELDGVLASSYLLRGLQKGNEKKYAEALIDIRRSVRYNPNDGDAWYNLGGVYFTLQKHDSAVLSFDRSIALNSKYKDDAANGMQAAISILQQQNKPVPEIKTTSR